MGGCRGGALLALLLHLAADIRPELLHANRHRIPTNLGSPDAHGVRHSTVPGGMIGVRDTARNGAALHLGDVEHCVPGIASGNENPADRVAQAMFEAAMAQLVIAGILVEE